ncbi:MAG: hypothetical protein K5656_03025, partial [Lachnospiraceae bacterium]|nr:hypothetical protein [Lachnospiraceae bacterium]
EAAAIVDAASFQLVTVNAPYMAASKALKNPTLPKTIARHEVMCDLRDVIRAASFALAKKGRFYMVHKPSRLAEIIAVMKEFNIEPKTMRMVHPYIDKEPVLVLIGGIKDGGVQMRVGAPLILYEEQGVYTEELKSIYGISE